MTWIKKKRIKSSPSKYKFIFYNSKPHPDLLRCQTCVTACFKRIPLFFWNKHSCNAVRWAPALENTSSCFCNTLVMCCQLSGQGTEPHPPVSEQMEKLSAKVWQSMEIPDKVQKYKRVCQNNGRCSGGEEGGGGGGGSGCEKVASRERQSKRKEPE